MTNTPLAGIRVADLTTVVMAPLATRMLGDMGAEVIRIEQPGGDVIRAYEPMRSPNMSAFGMSVNRNKRSIELDLKTEAGMSAAKDVIASCDVFVSNLRRGALERLGLDEAGVRALRPDVIYCVANGFGSNGPRADEPAYDDVVQAASGMASMFKWTGDAPQLIPSIMADKITGVHMAFAIAAALHGRTVTGEGCAIEVPMAETLAAFNLVEHLGGQTFRPQEGEFSYARVRTPNRRPRPTTDGWVVILPYSRDNWIKFWAHGGRPELADDERFVTTADRVNNADALYAMMDAMVATRSTKDWLDFCRQHSMPASEVVDLEQLHADPHFTAVDLFQDDHHPTEGDYRYVRDPIMFDGEVSPLHRHAPQLGQHTNEILTELGWTPQQISDLS